MARAEQLRYAFNRGLISPLALGRVDLKRSALSAEISSNWMPRLLGPMMLRPGLGYIGNTYVNRASRSIDFVRAADAASMHVLEFTDGSMRVWTSDALLTRTAVSATIANGDFNVNLANWTDDDDVGGVSAWVAGGSMGLTGNGTAAAKRTQAVAVVAAEQATEHALRIVIANGPVSLRLGTTSGGDEIISEFALETGEHSIAFTPNVATFYVQFLARFKRQVLVNSCNIEGPGVVVITSPYAAANLDYIRASPDSLSVDVLFVACAGLQQRRIERRSVGRSWSVVLYRPDNGPFFTDNVTTQTMTPGALSGNTTLTSSSAFFKSTHVGALFRVVSTGQTVSKNMTVVLDSTASIRVTGVGADRAITINLAGLTGTGNTVILQRSFDNATWAAVAGKTWAADTVEAYTDGLDNQIVYYRLRCTVYAAGTTVAILSIPTGSITGVCRAVTFTSSTVLQVEVITDFGDTSATNDWAEGLWSDYRGWPSAGALYEGRMGWGGYSRYVLSESDAFDSFNPDTVGDSGPISRTIGSGPLETINWMLPLQRLILGAQMSEHSVRSNAFDEPLTPANNTRKQASDRGSAAVQGIRNGARGFFVQRGGNRVMELFFDTASTYDYNSRDLTLLNPEVCKPRVVRMALQRQPDDRLHCVLSDGTAAVLVYDEAEKVECWIKITCAGLIEDVCVLPGLAGAAEDQVYYTALYTIGGATVRFRLKWALEAECQGIYSTDTGLNKQADAFVVCAGGSVVLAGLSHLEGATVVCWANGKDLGTYVVAGGQITASEAAGASGAVVGLSYQALWESAELGNTRTRQKNVLGLGLMLRNTHYQGLEIGQDFVTMDQLPKVVEGKRLAPDTVHALYHQPPQAMPGKWSADARLCLRATAPRPATVMIALIEGEVA